MSKISKLAAAVAVVPVLAFAAPVFADSPGQLQSGPDTYLVKNLTQKGSYAATANATACGDEIEYSIELHNTEFSQLTNIVVKATLPGTSPSVSNLTATPDLANAGTDGSVTVTLGANESLEYKAGSTRLYDGNAVLIKTLPDGIVTDAGINAGNLNGSTTEFLNFTAKVTCQTQPETPVYSCDAFHVVVDNDNRKVTVDTFTATGTNGAVFKQAVIDWGETGQQPLTTPTAVGQQHQYAADGTYTIVASAQFDVNGDTATATSAQCKQSVTFASTPTTPPTTPTSPEKLPDTGAGNVIAIVAGAVAAGTIGARLFLSRKLARR